MSINHKQRMQEGRIEAWQHLKPPKHKATKGTNTKHTEKSSALDDWAWDRINRGNNHKIHNCSKWGHRCFSCRSRTITHFTKLFQQQMNRLHMHYTNLLEIGQVHRSVPPRSKHYSVISDDASARDRPGNQSSRFSKNGMIHGAYTTMGKFLLVLHRQRSLIYICAWTLPQLLLYAQFPELC
jgi:hypothetical protein